MQFIDAASGVSQKKELVLEHKGERISFTIELYRAFTPSIYVVGDINLLLHNLPMEKQDALWQIYKEALDGILDIANEERLVIKLQHLMGGITDILSYGDVLRYVTENNTFWAPPDPKVTEVINGKQVTRAINEPTSAALTYTPEDFIGLNALIIYTKLYMPVLNQFHNRIIGGLDNKIYGFTSALEIMNQTDLYQSEGYLRLQRYVHDYWNAKKNGDGLSLNTLLSFVSDDNAIAIVVNDILFRRVLPAGLSHRHQQMPDESRPLLIRSLFHNVQAVSRELVEGRGVEHYMNKDTKGESVGNGEDQSSKLEQYRNVAEHTEQDIATVNFFCHDIHRLLHSIDKDVPPARLEGLIYDRHLHRTHHPFRRLMMSWLMVRFSSPSLIDTLDEEAYGNLFLCTLACLKHWGQEELAVLFDANINYTVDRDNIYDLRAITIEQIKELDIFYPFHVQTNRRKGDSRRSLNYAATAFTQVELEMKGLAMVSINFLDTLPAKNWTCGISITYLLADLFIDLNRRQLV